MSDDAADDYVDAGKMLELWYGPATRRGKEFALAKLADRRATHANKKPFDNASLPAGSPMYYACIGCGATIEVGEGWLTKPDCCFECEALVKLGWME